MEKNLLHCRKTFHPVCLKLEQAIKNAKDLKSTAGKAEISDSGTKGDFQKLSYQFPAIYNLHTNNLKRLQEM